ncbi:hypothetical protein I3760_02G096100 [Carya illinoinensis]|uniref:Membrane-associated kinase regulator 1 n=1 Tax=Carya illinoinensis TaxID=32201 RepID=A0A8T1REU0_CARIL|nr:probable membrane-associated kinase regulator 1 [Carya illinoinensis]KAG2721745.1 hypothetical protein I3760_02G096100 [Carya illinoinensis]KAG6664471.1 hypothetical protein CIPAW_02G095400 [Carya illinoinensis]
MGRKTERSTKSHTLPSSPSHSFSSSSSSSDFEFTISVSPRKSSTNLCPADELFYKGQLLPLHLSPRLSMVRTLLLASSSTSSSSDTTTTASRDSTGSSNDSHSSFNSDPVLIVDCDSSRPSSVTEDEEFNRFHNPILQNQIHLNHQIKKSKYFSLSRFSSVFRKETKNHDQDNVSASSVKRMSATAKDVVRKYLKKVKPLYEKLSQKQQLQQQQQKMGGVTTTGLAATVSFSEKAERSTKHTKISCKGTGKENGGGFSHSFSGNLRYPRRRSCASSCPSSMRSSPSHSGVLSRTGRYMGTGKGGGMNQADMSSMEELQNAIQGAIAHCKNSMIQNKSTVIGNEI